MKESCNPAKGSFFSPYALIRKQKPKKSVVNVVNVVFCGLTYSFSMGSFLLINCCTKLYLLQKKRSYNMVQPSTTIEFQYNKLGINILQQLQQKQREISNPTEKNRALMLSKVTMKQITLNTFAR